jgi:hypothetical protein
MESLRTDAVSTTGRLVITAIILAITQLAVPVASASGAEGRILTVGKDHGEQYDSIQAAANATRPGDTVLISGGTYRESLRPPTNGTADAPITFRGKDGEKVVIDGDKSLSSNNGLVNIDGRSYLRFTNLAITRSARHGLYGYQVKDIVVTKLEISYSSDGGAVFMDGSQVTVDGADVHHNNDKGTSADNEAISIADIDGFEVKNSRVHDNGEEGIDTKAEARHGFVHHNQVYDNRGPNIYVESVHDIDVYSNTVRGTHAPDKPGIMVAVEDYSKTRQVDRIQIYNNISSGNTRGGVGFWIESSGTISNISVVNNTLYDNGRGGIDFNADSFAGTNIIRNNILMPNPEAISGDGCAFDQRNNLTDGDPRFIDKEHGDVHLRDGSPAIGAGITDGAPATDFNGNPRTASARIDMGVYER